VSRARSTRSQASPAAVTIKSAAASAGDRPKTRARGW
jgi:hypothetical protein